MRTGTPPILTPTPALRAGREVAVLDKQQAVLVVGVPGVDVASPEMAQALLFQSWCSDMAGPVSPVSGRRPDWPIMPVLPCSSAWMPEASASIWEPPRHNWRKPGGGWRKPWR